ncbi:TlpA disulfide reductase family protein [Dyella sp. EPa41]|uniref:peroxiredoxin family protein n=1 Tax=Dyella sp. EPa41 TaxID=1561194 RepID=UPI001F43F254|nr:TlpA disulfide reductase family protein [Dyella sp. EPa41]
MLAVRHGQMKRAWRYLAVLVLLLAGMSAAFANELRLGQPAPGITLNTLDGRHISLDELRGKTVILTFWATWCEPCRDELPMLSRYAQEHAQDHLVVLGFSLDTPDMLDQVKKVASTLSFPTGLLGDPHVPGYGRIWRLPVSFVIDRHGLLVHDGWKDKQPELTRDRLETVVTPLLDKPPY